MELKLGDRLRNLASKPAKPLGRVIRAGVATPDYEVKRQEGKFEVREYPDLSVFSTPLDPERQGSAFTKLFRVIQGGNERKERIKMTAPVLIDKGTRASMSFIVPRETEEQGIPEPTEQNVTVGRRKAERVAVYRFSGRPDEEREEQAKQELQQWMKAQNLKSRGAPTFAYYDAPWIPGPLRRNEVMMRVTR